MSAKSNKERELMEAERIAIVSVLIGKESANGSIPQGSLDDLAKKISVSRATVTVVAFFGGDRFATAVVSRSFCDCPNRTYFSLLGRNFVLFLPIEFILCSA